MMVIFVGFTSNALTSETNVTTEGKTSPVKQALLHVLCKGNKKCFVAKLKAAKCKLGKFSLKNAEKAVLAYKKALRAKSVKNQIKTSAYFKKVMKLVVSCNVCTKTFKVAFSRGFKIIKSKKKAKKVAKKAKKVAKKIKKAKKVKKAAKKVKKAAKKVKKAAKKVKKAAKKAAKKVKKAVKKVSFISIAKSLLAMAKLC